MGRKHRPDLRLKLRKKSTQKQNTSRKDAKARSTAKQKNISPLRDFASLRLCVSLFISSQLPETLLPSEKQFDIWSRFFLLLRFQIETSKPGRGGRRYLPHVFTEHGVAMLSSQSGV